MDYEKIVTQIKAGMFPSLTGYHLSQLQVNEIETLLENHKNEISNYFNCCVKSRLSPTLNNVRES
jgi:hypothetical protein